MAIQLTSRFLSLVVHDLRTPLNVIGLTLRLIDQSIPRGNVDLDEDFRVVQENVVQIERMLVHLTDYCRLIDDSVGIRPTLFDPRRMLEELVEERAMRANGFPQPIDLAIADDCPKEVELDPSWARQAVQHALGNALAAAEGGPVRAILGGGPDRLVIDIRTEGTPPPSVRSTSLRPDAYERLFGTKYERRGLDLAISARVTELFGGDARLEVLESGGTAILLDWPTRLAGMAD